MFSVSFSSAGADGRGRARAVVRGHVPRRDRLRRRVQRINLAGALLAEHRVRERGGGNAHERGVAHVLATVREGKRAGLEVVVQGAGRGHPGQVGRLQDVQRLAHRGAAAAGGRHAVDVQVAVVHVRGRLIQGAVCGEIRRRQVACRNGQLCVGSLGRSLHRGRDLGRKRPAVEAVRALFREEPVCLGEVVVLEDTADGGGVTAREVEAAGRGKRLEPGFVVEGLLAERLIDHESTGGHLDGRLEGIAEAQRAPPVQGTRPGSRGAGDANGDAACDELGREIEGLAGRRVDERVVRHSCRCGLAAVDRAHLAGLRVVEHEVASAANPGTVRLSHAKGRGCGDGGIRCVAALAEDLDRRSGCLRIHGAHRSAVAGGG